MDVSENSGTPKSSILIGFSIINHPLWGTPIFGNTHMFSRHVKRLSNSTPSTPTFLRSHRPDRLWLDHHRSKTELLLKQSLKKSNRVLYHGMDSYCECM